MIERFLQLVRDRAGHPAHDQTQREAMIDALVWTMFADRHIASVETDRIRAEVRTMDWDAPTPAESFIDGSMQRVRRVLAGERSADDYLDEIWRRLGDDDCRQRVFKACLLLANVDGDFAPPEKALLRSMAHRFGMVGD